MKIKLKHFFLIILINIGLILLVFQLNNAKQTINKHNDDSTLTALKLSLKESYATNGKKIPSIKLLNLRHETIKLQTYLAQRKNVLLIYSEVSCNSCTDSLIKNCNKLVNLSNDFQIFAVANSKSIDYLRRFYRINKLKFPLLWDKDNALVKELKINLLPAILMINETGIIVNSFYISPKISELNLIFMEATSKWIKTK